MHEAFDLERGPLFRAALIADARGQRLWLAAHHLVVDGVSWRVLIDQLTIALQAGRRPARRRSRRALGIVPRSRRGVTRLRGSETLAQGWPRGTRSRRRPRRMNSFDLGIECRALVGVVGRQHGALLSSVHHAYGTEINDLLLAALGALSATGPARHPRRRSRRPWPRASCSRSRSHQHRRLVYQHLPGRDAGPRRLPTAIRDVKERLRAIPRRGVELRHRRYARPIARATVATPRYRRPSRSTTSDSSTTLAVANARSLPSRLSQPAPPSRRR